jgi:hypothetical protein
MKRIFALLVLVLATGMLWGQATTRKAPARKAPASQEPTVSADDVKALRDALAAQQQQIQQLRQEMQRRDEEYRAAQQKLEQSLTSTSEKATAAESTAGEQRDSVSKLASDVKDMQGNMTTAALQAQDEQKRVSAVEGLLGRFRFSGDVRVRQEDFFQTHDACPGGGASCNPRARERIRLRFGFEGKLNEDFIGGIFLASGVLTDPTSTNETLTNVFEKKTIGFDRGYIIYNPHQWKFLTLTGGKFTASWIKTPQTFDNDLNPEGFTEKFAFNVPGSGPLKNVTFQGIQLLYNEVNRPAAFANCAVGSVACLNSGTITGGDSFAAGGQVSAKLQLTKRWALTPSYTILNWRNNDVILNEATGITGGTASANFAPNGMTNAFQTLTNGGTTIRRFWSGFLYSDIMLDNTITTKWQKFPVRVVAEYLNNLNAQDHPLLASGAVATNLGKQSHLYKGELTFGRTANKGDIQFQYGFWRQEQDSVIASFDESDQRAPTNIIQHSFSVNYKIRANTVLGYTQWIGRTLNSNLQGAVLAPGITAGQTEPYLKRMQFDVVYSF